MLDEARALDAADPLRSFRDRFVIDDPELIYLDGNSLGRMPKAAAEVLDRLKMEWGSRLIRGWNEGWYDLPRRLGAKIAKLIGAGEDEVIVCDSTSVNLYKLLRSALTANQKGRGRWVLTDLTNFPSDRYVIQGATDASNYLSYAVGRSSQDEITLEQLQTVFQTAAEGTLLLSLSHTAFKTGYVYAMEAFTKCAHDHAIPLLWDLSHSVGAMPISLNQCEVDFAVGCTYKYLNGGPGAPAFLYVRRDLQESLANPIRGWFGHREPFRFDLKYEPASGIDRFLAGTPPILSMAAAEPGIDICIEAGMDAVRAKSVAQTEFLIRLFDTHLAPLGFELASPRDSNVRGSHVSIRHFEALAVDLALINEMKVIPDFRAPDHIRLGISPLYTRYVDVYEAVMRLVAAVETRRFDRYIGLNLEVT